MLKPRWPTVYPDPRDAIPVLLGAAEAGRLHDRGEVTLTAAEAAALRQVGYITIIGAGRWPAPHIPLDLLRPHASLAPLALFWYGPCALDPPPPPARPRRAIVEMTPAKRLRWRLGEAFRDPDQARILRSLAAADELGCTKRRLQQNQSKLPAARLNPALDYLVRVGLVLRHETWLMLSVEVREALHAVEIDVRRAKTARAMRTAKTRTSAGTAQEARTRTAACKRPYRRRPIPDWRRDRHRWGTAMRCRLGGLAVQRLYRKFGICPTAAATAARLAKRAQEERRQAAGHLTVT